MDWPLFEWATPVVARPPPVPTTPSKMFGALSNPTGARRQPIPPHRRWSPMRYACLVYFDPQKVFSRSAEAEVALRDAGDNETLKASGHLVMAEALQLPDQAITGAGPRRGDVATDGPFMESREVLGGFLLIEARISTRRCGSRREFRSRSWARSRRGRWSITASRDRSCDPGRAGRPRERLPHRGATRARDIDSAAPGLRRGGGGAARRLRRRREQWPRDGVPANPYSWLVSVGRFRTIDRGRRKARLDGALPELAGVMERANEPALPERIADDELRLFFICCHPALPPDARIALTLREVGGLTTEEIARAYLVPVPTIAQRIVRAKAKIRFEAPPTRSPAWGSCPLGSRACCRCVLPDLQRGLCRHRGAEPHPGRPLHRGDSPGPTAGRSFLPDPEALGLLALMLFHDARRATRVDAAGDLVLLEDQDRARWDRWCDRRGPGPARSGARLEHVAPHVIQAAIAAVHVEALSSTETDWRKHRRALRHAPARRALAGRGPQSRGRVGCATVRRRASWPSRPCSRRAASTTTPWRMPRAPTCSADSD